MIHSTSKETVRNLEVTSNGFFAGGGIVRLLGWPVLKETNRYQSLPNSTRAFSDCLDFLRNRNVFKNENILVMHEYQEKGYAILSLKIPRNREDLVL